MILGQKVCRVLTSGFRVQLGGLFKQAIVYSLNSQLPFFMGPFRVMRGTNGTPARSRRFAFGGSGCGLGDAGSRLTPFSLVAVKEIVTMICVYICI